MSEQKPKIELDFDFGAIGLEIKKAREDEGLSREDVAGEFGIEASYLAKIENYVQPSSLFLYLALVKKFHVSIDQYMYPKEKPPRSSKRLLVDELMNKMNDVELYVMECTGKALLRARELSK